MKITDETRRVVRLDEISKTDLLIIFQQKSGMRDISNFELKLASERGDLRLNADITGISLIGVSEVIE
ncbi:hypothetical protein [Arsenophonus sp. PmNCSU2021_1]|uniref:hypothetical protein n=1 Tax=Arsenophonus sp. PmNCSU2021_1 TaxID=3118989 RepID=UPI002FEF8661